MSDKIEDTEEVQEPSTAPANDPFSPPPSNAERAAAAESKKANPANPAAPAEDDTYNKEQDGEGEDAGKEGASEEAAEEDTELDTDKWGDVGDDETARSVLLTLQNSGVEPEEAKAMLWDAVVQGDPTLVDRDALVEKVGKAKATMILAGIENITLKNAQALESAQKAVYEVTGGEKNWVTAREWAKKHIPEKELEEYRDLLDRGGVHAKFAATAIMDAYNKDPKNTTLDAKTKTVVGDSAKPQTQKGISRSEYGVRLMKLGRNASQAEVAKLSQLRQLGIKQGI